MDACCTSYSQWYGKMSDAEESEYRRQRRRCLIIIVVSAFFLAIIIGTTIGVTSNKRINADSKESSVTATATVRSITAVCNVTQYPNSCYSSISSAKRANVSDDPKDLFKISLQVAIEAPLDLTSLPAALSNMTDNKVVQGALSDCKELFCDAIDRLNDSVQLMSPAPGEKLLTRSKISTLRSWLSGAITDQVTCMDGLEDTHSNIQEKMGAAMVNSTQFTSNSLAIVTKVISHLEDFDSPVH